MCEVASPFSRQPSPYKDCFHKAFKQLPLRSPQRPYLLWGYDRCDQPQKEEPVFGTRNDILFVGYDLRPFFNDTAPVMPGITFAPPRGTKGPHFDAAEKTQYLLTFRGDKKLGLNGVSKVRKHLKDAFGALPKRSDVIVNIHEPDTGSLQGYTVEYEALFNSTYTLVPRGHGRWTYRFSEAVGACSIPVVIADGLTLPYEELIDWSKASIRLPEKAAEQADAAAAILSKLPNEPKKVAEMRQEVCRISETYFRSMAKRADAMLLAAAVRSDRMAAEPATGVVAKAK
eukprot:TRINITY_DN29175_c0_g1_i2.p1 TRINITY_DN29175_c0_g1~~TRINITY_DN29175_c0_g1_i2.p1  ORF type:complete len:286 (-),score=54.31 TRINITY_DN29175_c0_g1_i2:27-884(-)